MCQRLSAIESREAVILGVERLVVCRFEPESDVELRQGRPRWGVTGVARQCLFVELSLPGQDLASVQRADVTVAQRPAAQIEVVCFELLGRLLLGPPNLGLVDVSDQTTDDALRDLVLQGEDVHQLAIIPLGPKVDPTACIDQLGRNADAVAAFAHAPFYKVPDTQLPRYLPKVPVNAAIGE